MILCKQVAHALADHRYWKLPWHRRIALRLHVAFCFVCGRYHRQVMLMQRVADAYVHHEERDAPDAAFALTPEARGRIRQKLREPLA